LSKGNVESSAFHEHPERLTTFPDGVRNMKRALFLGSATALLAGCGNSKIATPFKQQGRPPQFTTICSPDQDCSSGGTPTPVPVPKYQNPYATNSNNLNGQFSYDNAAVNFSGSITDDYGNLASQGTMQSSYSTALLTTNHNYYVPSLQGSILATLSSPLPSDANQSQTATLSNGGTITRTVSNANTATATIYGPAGEVWNATLTTSDQLNYYISWSGTSSGAISFSTTGLSTSSTQRITSTLSHSDCRSFHKLALAADGLGLALAFAGAAAPAGLMIAAFGLAVGAAAYAGGC
jgi:hypothetical protein